MKKILLATNTFFLLTAAFFIPSIARADPFCINNVSTISGRPCVIVTPNPPPGDGGNSTVSSVSAISTRDITPFCNGQTCTYVPLEPISGLPQTGQDFNGFLNGMFKLLFTIGGMVAVVSLVFGGVTYMVSEIVGKIEWAKKQMRAALWGLALLVVAWLILYTINPQLITFSFNPVEVRVTGVTSPAPGSTAPNANRATNVITNAGVRTITSTNGQTIPLLVAPEDIEKTLNAPLDEINCNGMRALYAASIGSSLVWAGVLIERGPTGQYELVQRARSYVESCANLQGGSF